MKIWLIQFEASLGNKRDNVEKMLDYIDRAARAKVNVVAFPEMALTGYQCHEKFRELAEPIPGPSTQPIADLAKKEGIYVTLGMPELAGYYMYNSAPLFGPEGVAGVWRKPFLATARAPVPGGQPGECVLLDEAMYFKAGTDIPTFDTRFGKLGIMICKDIWYPEIARTHAVRGAPLLLCISAAPLTWPTALFLPIGRARAMENMTWLGYVNLVGVEDSVPFKGGSFIANHVGEVVASASAGEEAREEIVEGEIDTEALLKAKLSSTFLKEVRPDILRLAAEAAARV